jgi:hypothetical protein
LHDVPLGEVITVKLSLLPSGRPAELLPLDVTMHRDSRQRG